MWNGSSNYGTSNATDLGGSCANELGGVVLVPSALWFAPVLVWRVRAGR